MIRNHKKLKPRIHIFHNGKVAELNYFQEFKHFLVSQDAYTNITNYCTRTGGKAPWQVIDEATKLKIEDKEDQIWCVFDIDDYLKNNPKKFEEGLKQAEKYKIKIAWSNQCFELWLLLHFEQVSTAISRKDYEKRLKPHFKKIGINYTKNCTGLFKPLLSLQNKAIERAKKLTNKPRGNPSTSIFQIVGELNKFLRN